MPSPSADLLAEIEAHAGDIAWGAGELLSKHFEGLLRVDYKDEAQSDPVTAADKETQGFLTDRILQRFPDHAVLGEEDDEDAGGETPLPDFVWALDPLDGTRNFVAGHPVYSSSVGVLHRGVPVAGAIYVPWPGCEGRVFHARSGGPALLNGEPVSVIESEDRGGRNLVALPANFSRSYRLPRSAHRGLGEVRGTGSIAHELALTASGVFEYTVVTRTHLWDVVAGIALVKSAGGEAMIERRKDGVRVAAVHAHPLAAPRLHSRRLGRHDHERPSRMERDPSHRQPPPRYDSYHRTSAPNAASAAGGEGRLNLLSHQPAASPRRMVE